eukprot:7502689-Pyramimonas_sp.AAC.1
MRVPPGHAVELPMGPQSAALGGGTARGLPPLRPTVELPVSHQAPPWVGELHASTPNRAF